MGVLTARQVETAKSPIRQYRDTDFLIKIIILIAFIERIIMFFHLGSRAVNDSDDVAYIQSGIEFAKSGTISVWSSYPTAKIMPAMPFLTGILCMLFGEGALYIDSIRICSILFGCATIFVFYKCCCFFTRKWIALIASSSFLLLNWAWSDNTVLTEPPYLFFYMLNFYFMLAMGEQPDGVNRKNAFGYALSFLAALMFRANILVMPVFCAFYLLVIKKKKIRNYLFNILVLALSMLVFLVPWSIRNYRLFGEFIPITSGSANPLLLGTYQGSNAPKDEELDYEKNVYSVIREQNPEYYSEDGALKEGVSPEIVSSKIDKQKTQYRLKEWWKKDKLNLLRSYLVSKPVSMLNWVWFWIPNRTVYLFLHYISIINLVLCILTVVLSVFTAKKQRIVLFLSGIYLCNLYTFAFSFASERYAAMSMPLRYFIAAIGLEIITELIFEHRMKPIP